MAVRRQTRGYLPTRLVLLPFHQYEIILLVTMPCVREQLAQGCYVKA